MNWSFITVLLVLLAGFQPVLAQSGDFGDETSLYAETKQVNQFFRRFNCEEGRNGERFYPGNPLYRDTEFRRNYLDILFDNESGRIPASDKREFISKVCLAEEPFYLDFHGGNWIAEVKTRFLYEGIERDLTLFLHLEKDRLGSKWVIERVQFNQYEKLFSQRTAESGEFLHPLSHELDFMNLAKVFRSSKDLQGYIPASFEPDQLTLFLLDVSAGKLTFRTVSDLLFHFFQMDGWYFELNDIQRSGFNTGWLITRLEKVNSESRTQLLHDIYHASH